MNISFAVYDLDNDVTIINGYKELSKYLGMSLKKARHEVLMQERGKNIRTKEGLMIVKFNR